MERPVTPHVAQEGYTISYSAWVAARALRFVNDFSYSRDAVGQVAAAQGASRVEPQFTNAQDIFTHRRFALAMEHFHTAVGPVERPVIHHPGAVAILARDAEGRLVLVRQYRYPLRQWIVEIPAGTCEPGEDPLCTARRELAEEAGFEAGVWQEVQRFWPAPGVSDEEMVLFTAEDLRPCQVDPDHGELIEVCLLAPAELPALIASGELADAKTLLACAALGVWP